MAGRKRALEEEEEEDEEEVEEEEEYENGDEEVLDDEGDDGDEATGSTLEEDGFVFRRLGKEEMNVDAWDDTALIKAWDKAVDQYKAHVKKGRGDTSGQAAPKTPKTPTDSRMKGTTPSPSPASSSTRRSLSKWKVGDECMALWKEDNTWYRATIERVTTTSQGKWTATVLFTDYGNRDKVGQDELKPITSQKKKSIPTSSKKAVDPSTIPAPPSPMAYTAFASPFPAPPAPSAAAPSPWGAMPGWPPHLQAPPPPQWSSMTARPNDEALMNMVMAWYFSGYYTGYYQAKSGL